MIEEIDCRVALRAAPTPVWPSAVRVRADLRLCGTDATATVTGVLLGTPTDGRMPVRDVACEALMLPPSTAMATFRALCTQAIAAAGDVAQWGKVEFRPNIHADGDLFFVVEVLNKIAASDG